MGNNLAVTITADIVDLQTKFATAKAEVQGLNSEFQKLARSQAAGTLDSAGQQRFQQLAATLIQAKAATAGYASSLQSAGVSLGSFGRAAASAGEHSATGVRYVRELFDEISSGRTRYLPSTIAAFSQSVLKIPAATLGAVGGVAALAAGIGYLAYRSAEASDALDKMHVATLRMGEDTSRAALGQLTDQLTKLPGIASSDAAAIVGALANVHMPFDALGAAARIAAEQMAQTGQSAEQVGQQIAKAMDPQTSATEVAKQLQGSLTQAQVNAAEAADKSGNENAILAEKLALLEAPLDRARTAVGEYQKSWTQAATEFVEQASSQVATLGIVSAQTEVARSNAQAWTQNAAAIKQYGSAVSSLPKQDTLTFDKSSGNSGLLEYMNLLKQIGEERQRQAEKELEEANQTLDAMVEAARQAQEQTQAIARQDADTSIQLSREKVEAEKAALQDGVTATSMSAAQKYARLKQLTEQEEQLDLQQLQNELATLKDQPVEYDRVLNQIKELKQRNILDLEQLDKQYAAENKKTVQQQVSQWRGTVDEIESAEGNLVSSVLSKRRSLSEALLQMSGQLVQREIEDDIKAATTELALAKSKDATQKALEQGGYLFHLGIELQKKLATTTSLTAQTAATTAASSQQTAAMAAGAAAQKASAMAQIGANAGVAASGAMASVAAIPFTGWAMAPAVGASTAAQAVGYEGLASFDVGAWEIPRDMVAQIHKGESVVPATFAQGMRSGGFAAAQEAAESDKGGGGDNHYHINTHALDSRSVERFFRSSRGVAALAGMRSRIGR